jgi:large subunit ribosomal protein L5e
VLLDLCVASWGHRSLFWRLGFDKVVKSKTCFKRYQVKFRGWWEGKTDHYVRKHLVIQDKNKYNILKCRWQFLCLTEISLLDCLCTIRRRYDMCAAYTHKLPKHGVKIGITNYAAAIALACCWPTGLVNRLGTDKISIGGGPSGGDWRWMQCG